VCSSDLTKWRGISCPVVTSPAPKDWSTARTRALWALRPRQRAFINKLQTFYGRKKSRKGPERHWLYVLDELWNADKHRAIHLITAYSGCLWTRITPDELSEAMEAKVIRARPVGPFEHDTEEIARYRISPRQGSLYRGRHVNMQVHFGLSFEVAFGERTPLCGANVMRTLTDLSNCIVTILLDLKPDLAEPLPVWSINGTGASLTYRAGTG